jgi:hypothetical protein
MMLLGRAVGSRTLRRTTFTSDAFAAAEKQMPHASGGDAFSRQERVGWSNWDLEPDKFEEAV